MSHCIPGLEPEVDVYLCSACSLLSILIGNHTRKVLIERVGIPYQLKICSSLKKAPPRGMVGMIPNLVEVNQHSPVDSLCCRD